MTSSRLAAALLGSVLALGHPAWADEDATAWRLFVADHTDPTITAIDLDAPDQRWSFEVAGPARLYASAEEALIIAVQSDHDQVDFLRSGLTLESHGDHADIEVSEPEPIGSIAGPRPFHVVTHAGEVAINFDRGGYAGILDEGALLDGKIDPQRFPMNVAHHGFVAAMGDYFLSSIASEQPVAEDELPPRVGLGAFAADGTPLGDMHTCTDLHGEAFSGSFLLAGCGKGVIAHDTTGGPDAFTMLPYPADFPEDKTGTLLGSTTVQVFLGNYGADSVVIVDPTVEPYFTRVELPFRRVDFILDPAKPQFAYILTEDGSLHRLNMLSAAIEQSAKVTQPYSMDGHWRDPRPRLAVADDRLILTDPLDASLRIVSPADFTELDRVALDGLPYNVVAVGGSGLIH
ncbi:MAG: hypothetical protein ACFB6S_10770 [Geminicoccaceae bacterium]